MLIFIAILLRSYEDARQGCCKSTLIKTAARQGCCETRKAFVRLTTELALTHFAHKCRITVQRPCALLNGCHKNHTNRMNPWSSHDCPPAVLAIALQLCNTSGDSPACECKTSVRASYGCLTFSENLHEVCYFVLAKRSYDWCETGFINNWLICTRSRNFYAMKI